MFWTNVVGVARTIIFSISANSVNLMFTGQLQKCVILIKTLTINIPAKLKTAAAHSNPKVLQRYPPAIGPTNNLQQTESQQQNR